MNEARSFGIAVAAPKLVKQEMLPAKPGK